MNKILVVCFLLSIVACSRQNKTVIVGNVQNADGSMSYLQELRITSVRTLDSVEIGKNGNFRYKISLDESGYYQINFSGNKSLTLILSPGEKLKLHADLNNFYNTKTFEGSENTALVNELHDSLRIVILKLNSIKKEFRELDITDSNYNKNRGSLEALYSRIQSDYHRHSLTFIFKDFSSLTNIAALYQEYSAGEYVFNSQFDIQIFKLVSDTLIKYYPKVQQVKILKDNYQAMLSAYQNEKLLQIIDAAEKDLPDLLLPDQNGKLISLSSLKGKTVLLTFWSINQSESIENVIGLKKIYKEYKNKGFEIYQVSVDRSILKWQNALDFEEINWISVIDTAYPGSSTRTLFNVNELPLNYLINADQSEIIAKKLTPGDLNKVLLNILYK